MTKEEIIAGCKITTKEQFIEECRKNSIEDDWYNFSEEHTRPVSIGMEQVTYGRGGWTGFAFPETRWDTAMEQLLIYKDFIEWEKSGSPFKIKSVEFKTAHYLHQMINGYAVLWNSTQTEEPVQELLDDGWIFDSFDRYLGECHYHKAVRFYDLKGYIEISVIKRTDERDRKEFGFTENSMPAFFRYPAPGRYLHDIFECMEKDKTLSEEVKNKLVKYFEKSLIDDEFNALVQLKKDLPKAMQNACDSSLPKEEQKKAILEAAHDVERSNPANEWRDGSRSLFISKEIYDSVLKKLIK